MTNVLKKIKYVFVIWYIHTAVYIGYIYKYILYIWIYYPYISYTLLRGPKDVYDEVENVHSYLLHIICIQWQELIEKCNYISIIVWYLNSNGMKIVLIIQLVDYSVIL